VRYETSFGALGAKARPRPTTGTFRLAVLGDFSGRASRGEVEIGDALGQRKAHLADVDTLDDLVKRLAPTLSLDLGQDAGREGEVVEIELRSMDDFHPDELYDNLEFFEELASLHRQINGGGWEKVADKVRAMAEATGPLKRVHKARSGGSSVPNSTLSDFAKLTGRAARDRSAATVDQLIQGMIGPYVARARSAEQDALAEAVNAALSGAMRRILHHPDFQSVEALWRSVELLVRRVETGPDLQIALIDVSAEEFAADLASAETLEDTGLYKLLIETPSTNDQAAAFSAILGCYEFNETPPHADLLGRMAKLAAAANAPFLAGIDHAVIRKADKEEHPMVAESWGALRALPHSRYLGLACPRFMLRNPYGAKTDPIDPFEFEEFTARDGLGSMLYANGAVLPALLLATAFRQQGALDKLDLTKTLSLGEMPYHFVTDDDGDQVALPCTDRLLTERMTSWVTGRGIMPVLSLKGRPEIRLGGFLSLGGGSLAGPWAPVTITEDGVAEPTPEPENPDEDDTPDTPAAEDTATDDDTDRDDTDRDDTDLDDADNANAGDDDSGDDEVDDELAALLADLDSGGASDDDDDSGDDTGDDEEMDPELAALLADL